MKIYNEIKLNPKHDNLEFYIQELAWNNFNLFNYKDSLQFFT